MGAATAPPPVKRRPTASPSQPARARPNAKDAPPAYAPWIRLAVFVGLAGYASAYWASFVTGPPAGRVVLVVLTAAALGAALIGLNRLAWPRWAIHSAAAALTLTALGFALVRMGVPDEFLRPEFWNDFAAMVDRGLTGLRTVRWPYNGEDPVVSLVVMLALPPVLILAAALAFWPVKRSPGLDAIALVLLVALYGVAITDQKFSGELGRGVLLLLLIAAWLWLPRLNRKTALAAAAAVAAAGLCALPVAHALDAEKPWVAYEDWGLGGEPGQSERFEWNHQYGPITWPRTGKTLLTVRSESPHYWKAETLDSFDGLRWSHTRGNDRIQTGSELPPPDQLNTNWLEKMAFSIQSLRSNLLIGAGTITEVDEDLGIRVASVDGTVRLLERPLQEGDSYEISAYVPDPDQRAMRNSVEAWSEQLRSYVRFGLPELGATAINTPPDASRGFRGRSDFERGEQLMLPFRGEAWTDDDRALEQEILASPYARMYRLATRLAEGHTNTYDVVRATELYLQRNLQYSERVPTHEYPLDAFVFEDKLGYCQHFSGAMALMLRMNGIPARVAAGFAPGIYDTSTREHRVRDLDAHSWVEVYFTGIGWVPFDPTPTASPAGSQSSTADLASAARGGAADESTSLGDSRADGGSATGAAGGDGSGSDDGLGFWAVPLFLLIMAAVCFAALVTYSLVHERRHARAHPADSQLAELHAALERMGVGVPPRTTLSALERRLSKYVGPSAARYARLLRDRRYGPPGAPGPKRADRIALRRELGASAGRLGRLRAMLALPPRRRAAQ
jgi:transglutaminase-like putative cysteine protease